MTRVEFYLLEGWQQAEDELRFACRLVETALRKGSRVHLHFDDADRLARMDDLLWTFRPDSFLPHERADAPLPDCPVTLGQGPFAGDDGVLINLAAAVPEFFSQFPRVAEIVATRAPTVGAGRARYRFYRDRGYKVEEHRMKPRQARHERQ